MAENGTSSFPVSLRPKLNEKDDGSDDLIAKIRLINQQRDGFRNVTEEELLVEVNEGKGVSQDESESESEDGDEAKRGTLDAVFTKRGEMYRSLGQARENALWALDSFSLTASSVLKQGFQTASPVMQQSIPEGSFSFERRQLPQGQQTDPEKERRKTELWAGSFMTNNTDAADALLAAATRLEGLVKAETEYWGQLLSLTSKGWPVYKPQGNNAPMHVRFVASEAAPYFKSQGVARLTPNKDGTIELGRRVGNEPKTLRLRLVRNGETLASSVTASLLSLADLGSSLEDKVSREQNSLFEEELFQEMAMESRLLQPLGVKLRNNVLHLPVGLANGSQDDYLVDLVPIDQAAELITTNTSDDKDLLDAQSVLLRLLLCHVYHQRLQRRSQPPPPLTETARKEPPSSIIRSFIALAQHHNVCLPLSKFLSSLSSVLRNAGISFSCTDIKTPGLHTLIESVKAKGKKSTLHSLLEQASQPQKTTATLRLKDEHILTIHATTDLAPPIYGNEFSVLIPQALASLMYGPDSHDKKVTFAETVELKDFLCQLLALYVSRHLLLPGAEGWEVQDEGPILCRQREEGRGKVAVGVRVGEGKIVLVRRVYGGEMRQEKVVWKGEGGGERRSIVEVFGKWIKEG